MGKYGKGDTSWFTHDRFGMFIHWGLYSMAARHEWVRNFEQMSDDEYQKYFDLFYPDMFNPKEWAKAAKSAGMTYFVLTDLMREISSTDDFVQLLYRIEMSFHGCLTFCCATTPRSRFP